MMNFRLHAPYGPCGDQPQAIQDLAEGIREGRRDQVLLGVTGSGKTYTIAKIVEAVNRSTLVIAHNKTLAAQLFQEFKEFFPENAVEYFVSYYDYYQPEAYLPVTDTYIEKDARINEDIDRLRHSATRSVYERRDVLIVASVSCIYGLGSPESYYAQRHLVQVGQKMGREEFLNLLVSLQYSRQDAFLERGSFRARGDTVEVLPSYGDAAYRLEFFGSELDAIARVDPLSGRRMENVERISIYPKTHYVTGPHGLDDALASIRLELGLRLEELRRQEKALEAERLERRTLYDLEMLQELQYCHGIENYSRHFDGRAPGEPPYTLLDYLPEDFLLIVDESHQSLPQLRGMFEGDRSRKSVLVEHGFRLPSALDNRPLRFKEFERKRGQTVFVSATPGPYELKLTKGEFAEQVIRPTGLMDPEIEVRPVERQVDDLLHEVRERVRRKERVLVTTLTKRMAEELKRYYENVGVRVKYLHSEVDTLERVEILRGLRKGDFDVLVGVNLLREGLDLPEVSLVAVFDADKEGFLRSTTALIQTAGRAARNVRGKVLLYASTVTRSMRDAMEETTRRRRKQLAYNREHGITPRSIEKPVSEVLGSAAATDYYKLPPPLERPARKRRGRAAASVREKPAPSPEEGAAAYGDTQGAEKELGRLEREMRACAERLEFEKAAAIRDQIKALKAQVMFA
ncbi:MAG: excinuclease ABC subunit UvrB [Acidobacteriota bacterium]|nr:MAG: excinuclease ABC subunit UvrB [Acidobacteriota bacterium]